MGNLAAGILPLIGGAGGAYWLSEDPRLIGAGMIAGSMAASFATFYKKSNKMRDQFYRWSFYAGLTFSLGAIFYTQFKEHF